MADDGVVEADLAVVEGELVLGATAALERDFPQVRFVAWAVPLMTEPTLPTRIKSLLVARLSAR